jgi:glucokinase
MYKKWAGKAISLDDFILITIRSGVGTGIFYQGELMRGAHGMAGEVSHLTIVEDGKRCRCGRQGCLETLVNQDVLYQEYLRNVLHKTDIPSSLTTETEVRQGLAALFSLAKQGNENASTVIQDAAHYIGRGIAALLKILDIPHIIIAADFGPDGDALIPYITRAVKDLIIPGIDFSVVYYPLDQLGFARGAALLILKEYLTTL